MKKFNKKIYVFFSLFFLLSLFIYPPSLVFANTKIDTKYVPSLAETQCYVRYEPQETSSGGLSYRRFYFCGTNGSSCVGYLQDGYLFISNVGNLVATGSEDTRFIVVSEEYDKDGLFLHAFHSEYGAMLEHKPFSITYDELSSNKNLTLCMKIFSSRTSAVSYSLTGDTSGLISDSSELADSDSVYAPDIGYLQNVKFNSRNVGKDNSDLSNLTYHFSYDSVTNTGFNIDQDGVRVSFYSTYKGIYYDNWGSYFKKDGNIKRFDNKILQKSASRMDRLNFSYEDCMRSHSQEKAELDKLCDSSVPTFGAIEYWLRIEQRQPDGTWRYGGWVYLADNSTSAQGDSAAEDYITQTIDGDGNLDKDGGYGTGTSTVSTYGEGATADEADADAERNEKRKQDSAAYRDSFESIDDFKDYLALMGSSLQSIPQIIGETFTALPPLIIIAISSGFLVCIVLRILGR